MITINAAFGQEEKVLGTLGRIGENETRQIVFDCSDILTEYPGAEIVCVMQRHCDRIAYLADAVLAGNVLTVTLTDADVSASGDLRIELRALTDGKIRKSAVYMGQVVSSLRGAQDRPGNPIADVLNRIDMTISRAEESIAEADAAAQSAREVADTVQTKLDNGDFVGEKGEKGDPGDVQDVQVAGVSVLQDGVANVPIATADAPGVVSIVSPQDSGIWNDNGKLKISYATDAEISGRLGTRKAIVCSNMDYAVKAAMCDGKGAAWTEAEQKAARERMGADGNYVLIEETVLTEETSQFERAQEPDGTPYNLAAIKVVVKFVPGQTKGAFFCYGKNSGIRIIGGASQTLAMPSSSGPADFRSVAIFDAKPEYGSFYNCETAVGSQGGAMPITRASGGAYTTAEISKKIQSIAFYLYFDTVVQMVAGTEIAIYGVRA